MFATAMTAVAVRIPRRARVVVSLRRRLAVLASSSIVDRRSSSAPIAFEIASPRSRLASPSSVVAPRARAARAPTVRLSHVLSALALAEEDVGLLVAWRARRASASGARRVDRARTSRRVASRGDGGVERDGARRGVRARRSSRARARASRSPRARDRRAVAAATRDARAGGRATRARARGERAEASRRRRRGRRAATRSDADDGEDETRVVVYATRTGTARRYAATIRRRLNDEDAAATGGSEDTRSVDAASLWIRKKCWRGGRGSSRYSW